MAHIFWQAQYNCCDLEPPVYICLLIFISLDFYPAFPRLKKTNPRQPTTEIKHSTPIKYEKVIQTISTTQKTLSGVPTNLVFLVGGMQRRSPTEYHKAHEENCREMRSFLCNRKHNSKTLDIPRLYHDLFQKSQHSTAQQL